MSGSYGITPAGFVVKPLSVILAGLQAAWLAGVDPEADLSSTTPEGQILGITSNEYSELWELAQAGWNAYNRGDVEGAGLDNLGDISGIPRGGPTYTQVVCNLTISAADAPYAPGTLVASVDGDPTLAFSNLETVTTGMISAGQALGVTFQCTTIGATPSINPATLTNIVAPVTGWSAISNPAAQSQAGANEQTDNAYQIFQETEVSGVDAENTFDALVAAILSLGQDAEPPVALVVKIENNTSDIPLDVGGGLILPPHTFAPIVYNPPGSTVTNQQIAQAIWNNTPPGISSTGSTAVSVTDAQLGPQTAYFVIPTPVPIYIAVTVALQPNYAFAGPDGVAAAVVAALVSAATTSGTPGGQPPPGQLLPGGALIGSQESAVVQSVPGVLDVQALAFDVTPAPVNMKAFRVQATQIGALAPSQITVTQGTGI